MITNKEFIYSVNCIKPNEKKIMANWETLFFGWLGEGQHNQSFYWTSISPPPLEIPKKLLSLTHSLIYKFYEFFSPSFLIHSLSDANLDSNPTLCFKLSQNQVAQSPAFLTWFLSVGFKNLPTIL